MTEMFKETYYELLKIESKASVSEIVAAYHSAKSAFAKDSVATYSLFSNEEAQSILDRIEEAYQTLSNLEKRTEYDQQLRLRMENPDYVPKSSTKKLDASIVSAPPAIPQESTPSVEPPEVEIISGAFLRQIREKRGLTLEDATRITKVPLKSIRAIEGENLEELPARVYVQGFVKNLASLYKLNPQATAKSYLELHDKRQEAEKK